MNKRESRYLDNLTKAFLSLKNEKECRAFLSDVCTVKELQDMAHRLEVARLLTEGTIFNEISRLTGTSSATISRVNKCLGYGPGGYDLVLERIGDKSPDKQ